MVNLENVHRKQRPGYPSKDVQEEDVREWISEIRDEGVESLVVFLSEKELNEYYDDLLGMYEEEFGEGNVLHAPIEDFSLCDPQLLHDEIIPFMRESVEGEEEVAAHCSAGVGRTGQVLFAWLVNEREMEKRKAMQTVREIGCNPTEAVGEKELLDAVRS